MTTTLVVAKNDARQTAWKPQSNCDSIATYHLNRGTAIGIAGPSGALLAHITPDLRDIDTFLNSRVGALLQYRPALLTSARAFVVFATRKDSMLEENTVRRAVAFLRGFGIDASVHPYDAGETASVVVTSNAFGNAPKVFIDGRQRL